MSILVLAEKPSVARDLARVLGAGRRGEGYLEGRGYRVTWALGHLVHFAEPDDYGPAWAGRWSLAQLPMVPERWRLRTDERTASQLRIVQGLLNAPDTEAIVCATDAGREGEHIFRLIYEYAGCRKPFQRLWVSSLTDEAIREGFARLQPGAAFTPLAQAARARAQADWLVGMNLTRAYTVRNRVLCTIGRVQTPTLAMIVARDQAIAGFVKAYFYELVATLAEGFQARYCRDGETRLDNRAEAERLLRQLVPETQGRVKGVDVKVRRHRPPSLYDLTSLQRDANRRFGLTAAQVLEQAQALYETHKLISYPRTESRHIPEDLVPRLPGILRGLEQALSAEAAGRRPDQAGSDRAGPALDPALVSEALARLAAGHRLGKGYVDNAKLTDHHAILPTGKGPPAGLPAPARRIFDLVVARFVAVFLPDEEVEETLVSLDIGGADFIARGRRVLELGWRRVEPPRRRAAGLAVISAAISAAGSAPGPTSGPASGPASGHTAGTSSGPGSESLMRPATRSTAERASTSASRTAAVVAEDLASASPPGDPTLAIDRDEEGEEAALPPLKTGQVVHVTALELVERETQPPRPYDDATLLAAMKNAGREIEDDRLAAAMRESGLGTPATRAEIIEKLIRTGYVERQRKQLRATAKGQALIGLVADSLRSPELTARWEQRLKEIEQGQGQAEDFYRDIVTWVKEGVIAVVQGAAMRPEQAGASAQARPGGKAGGPKARNPSATKPGAARPHTTEPWATKPHAAKLNAVKPRPSRPKAANPGAASPSAPQPDAATPKVVRPRADLLTDPLTCPKCGQGRIIEGRRGFGCDRYREGCDFVIWKEVMGRTLAEAEIRQLVLTRHTGLIRGLTGPGGVRLDARLCLDERWQVVLDFPPEGA